MSEPPKYKSWTRLPPELYQSICEFLIRTKSLTQSVNLTNFALVSREWRDLTRPIIFRNIDIGTDISAIRTLTELCHASSTYTNKHGSVDKGQTLGSFINHISITLGQPTGYGMIAVSDLVSLLLYTPELKDLSLVIIQPDQVARDLKKISNAALFQLPSFTTLRVRSYSDASKVLPLLVARFPSLQHLFLDVFVETMLDDYIPYVQPASLVSFRSLGCWEPQDSVLSSLILNPSNTTLRAIELHRSPSPNFIHQLAEIHGKQIESLTLRSMEPATTPIWEDIIGSFTSLQHLSVWYFPSASFLDSVCTRELRHFEFRRPWTHNNKDEAQLADIISFLKQCPMLRSITYHAAKPIPSIDELAREERKTLTWRENHHIDGYMEDPRDFQAVPYATWQTQAFPPSPPRMTKPRAPKANVSGYDASGWDLPIHSAKSDLFM